jgi:hypothetical protein
MAHAVSPSATNPVTAGQIGKLQDLLGAALRKSGLQSEPTQQVLESQGAALAEELVAVVRKHVEAVSNMIVRRAKVDRTRTPEQVIDATCRVKYVDDDVVETMPNGEGDEVDVYFFKVGRYLPVDEVAKEYELRGLKSDPYAQAAVNEADPTFADDHPNGSQWGKNCCLMFNRWNGRRDVYCNRSGDCWDGGWWFAGVRK